MSLKKSFSAYTAAVTLFTGTAFAANDAAPAAPAKPAVSDINPADLPDQSDVFLPETAAEIVVLAKSKDGKDIGAGFVVAPSLSDFKRLQQEKKLISQEEYFDIVQKHANALWAKIACNINSRDLSQETLTPAAQEALTAGLKEHMLKFMADVQRDSKGISTRLYGIGVDKIESAPPPPTKSGKPHLTF